MRIGTLSLLLAGLLVVLVSAPVTVLAAPGPDQATKKKARDHFTKGGEHYAKERYTQAIAEFQKALQELEHVTVRLLPGHAECRVRHLGVESGLESGKWKVTRDDEEARTWYDDRFRPQQTKRLGPGYLAAEIVIPTQHMERFLDRARTLADKIGVHLESEVYFLDEGRALVIAGYMTQGPRSGFLFEMALAPMLVDLAMARYDGSPYVLGRWQSPFFKSKQGSGGARQLRRMKKRADPRSTLNPGVFMAPVFRVPFLSDFYRISFPLGLRVLRVLYGVPGLSQIFRSIIGNAPRHKLFPRQDAAADQDALDMAATLQRYAEQAQGCVNCGECNAVCPIFTEAGIRLPQMLTHIGDLVAQIIPRLPLYKMHTRHKPIFHHRPHAIRD